MLRDWSNGDKKAHDQLFRAVYNELHRQAAGYLRHEHPGLSLQTTDLIHEAYLRLIDQQHVEWQNRLHFFGIAGQVMRRILVDHARSRQAAKTDVSWYEAAAYAAFRGKQLPTIFQWENAARGGRVRGQPITCPGALFTPGIRWNGGRILKARQRFRLIVLSLV